MNLQQRIDLLSRLGEYILSDNETWQQTREKASRENSWFIPEFIDLAVSTIARHFLQKDLLEKWTDSYQLRPHSYRDKNPKSATVGIVMAGNIPLAGFHDLLCVFISGHRAMIKTSSKDKVLVSHLADTLTAWDPTTAELISFGDMLKGCDAYIATGSNNSSGYFDYYFGKYPHIIRRNRTSVAVLTGEESREELAQLADDVYLYFGRGCRNVTKLYVPRNYDFIPLLSVFKKYNHLAEYHKYKNNYDYNLAIHLLNKQFYMSNESILLVENLSPFAPISQLHYEFYDHRRNVIDALEGNEDLQCIVGRGFIPFGRTQHPSVMDYADGVDTLRFLEQIP
jgi:Acyl-CoA reductase (LuxC)